MITKSDIALDLSIKFYPNIFTASFNYTYIVGTVIFLINFTSGSDSSKSTS